MAGGFSYPGIQNGNNTTPIGYTGGDRNSVVPFEGAFYVDNVGFELYTYKAGGWHSIGGGVPANVYTQGGNAFPATAVLGNTNGEELDLINNGVTILKAKAYNAPAYLISIGDTNSVLDGVRLDITQDNGFSMQGGNLNMNNGDVANATNLYGIPGADLIVRNGDNTVSLNIGVTGFDFNGAPLINMHDIDLGGGPIHGVTSIDNGGSAITVADTLNTTDIDMVGATLHNVGTIDNGGSSLDIFALPDFHGNTLNGVGQINNGGSNILFADPIDAGGNSIDNINQLNISGTNLTINASNTDFASNSIIGVGQLTFASGGTLEGLVQPVSGTIVASRHFQIITPSGSITIPCL